MRACMSHAIPSSLCDMQDLGVDQLLLEVSRELYNEEIDAEDDLIEDLIKTRGGKEAPGKKAPASGH